MLLFLLFFELMLARMAAYVGHLSAIDGQTTQFNLISSTSLNIHYVVSQFRVDSFEPCPLTNM